MTFYFAMTNSWSLLYDEIYGDETMTDDKINITTGVGNTASTVTTNYSLNTDDIDNISINTAECPEGITNVPLSSAIDDKINITSAGSTDSITSVGSTDSWIYESPDGGKTVTRRGITSDPMDKEVITGDYFGDNYAYVDFTNDGAPYTQTFLADNDDTAAHHFVPVSYGGGTVTINTTDGDKKKPSIEDNTVRKYKEDESIKALQDYISTTYGGHYTSKENNVQTLDLIESVGDAESFCRSNAIKYLSRYDKKGQAKRDILKALHYSLLLYHFSGQLKETTTRGYETF